MLFIPSGLLPNLSDRLSEFVDRLGHIAANSLAQQRWDGLDAFTEYQALSILPGYTIQRSYLRFNVILDKAWLMPVDGIDGRAIVQLD